MCEEKDFQASSAGIFWPVVDELQVRERYCSTLWFLHIQFWLQSSMPLQLVQSLASTAARRKLRVLAAPIGAPRVASIRTQYPGSCNYIVETRACTCYSWRFQGEYSSVGDIVKSP